ncbi:MAG: hypothetical protein PVJ67_05900 [Candidatus Pacearchaeota archaeon]|jgi:hypothetical protein
MKKKKRGKNKSGFDKYFLLSWKKLLMIIGAWVLAVLLHNLVYGLGIYFFGKNFWGPGGDEAFFFIIAIIIIPIYFLIMIIYSLIKLIIKGTKKFG